MVREYAKIEHLLIIIIQFLFNTVRKANGKDDAQTWYIEGKVVNVRYWTIGKCEIAVADDESEYGYFYHQTRQLELCHFAERAKVNGINVGLAGFQRTKENFLSANIIDYGTSEAKNGVP